MFFSIRLFFQKILRRLELYHKAVKWRRCAEWQKRCRASKVSAVLAVCLPTMLLLCPGCTDLDGSAAQLEPAATLYVPPLSAVGELMQVSVVDAAGNPVAGGMLKVDDRNIQIDAQGLASFVAPDKRELVLSVPGARVKLVRSGDLFRLPSICDQVAQALCMEWSARRSALPHLLYAPAVIEAGSEFIVTGYGLPGNIADTHVILGGREMEVLAASQRSIMVRCSRRLEPAPVRAIYLAASGIDSNTLETDVCRLELSLLRASQSEPQPEQARVSVVGTNLPCLVCVTNLSPETTSLWLPDQTPAGKRAVFLTPGGESNNVIFTLKRKHNVPPELEMTLLPEVPLRADRPSASAGTVGDLCCASIVRLQRRLTAVEEQLDQLRRNSESLLQAQTNELRALSLRRARLEDMLQARRQLLLASGGTHDDYLQALETAVSGANVNIDLKIDPVRTAAAATTETALNAAQSLPRQAESVWKTRPLLQRFIVPRIKLLPPMSPEEVKVHNEISRREQQRSAATEGAEQSKKEETVLKEASTVRRENSPAPKKTETEKRNSARVSGGKSSRTSAKESSRKTGEIPDKKSAAAKSAHAGSRSRRATRKPHR